MQLTGRVIKRPFAKGSKSEREAIFIVAEGEEHLLRRRGGNPFFDPKLEEMVGKTIRCEGIVTGQTFVMSEWTEIEGEAEGSADTK